MTKKKILTEDKKLKETKGENSSDTSDISKKEPHTAKALSGEPQTMADLLAMEGEKVKGLRKGEIVDGIVTEVASKTIYIDVGAKTDGVILGKEFEKQKDYIRSLKPGDKVKAYVGSIESENGQILLSLRQAAGNFAWEGCEEKLKSQEDVNVKGREVNRGGLIVDSPFGLQGFIPGSQIGSIWQGKLEGLLGKTLVTKVIEVNREQNRLVFSEKLVSDKEKIAKAADALKKLKLGEIFEAEINQIVPFGLFVKVKIGEEEIEGLVHISEVSWQKVDNLGESFKPKGSIKVKVISLEGGRVQFSIKQLLPDPWDILEEKYPVDSKLSGKVMRLTSFGALVQIETGIEGLIHISKIPPEFIINEGDQVDVYIESIDKKTRRISLGLVLSQKPIGYK